MKGRNKTIMIRQWVGTVIVEGNRLGKFWKGNRTEGASRWCQGRNLGPGVQVKACEPASRCNKAKERGRQTQDYTEYNLLGT